MNLRERRRHFLIDKSFQFRYMLTISFLLIIVTSVSLTSFYFGIWGDLLQTLSNEEIRNDLLTASRLQQYEEARYPQPAGAEREYGFYRQVERLQERQQELLKQILDQTKRNLITKLLFLVFLIALGTIFLSHRIAGPLYRFQKILEEMGRGNFSVRCHSRKFDEARSLSNAFNHVLEFLDGTISRIKKIVAEDEKDVHHLRLRLNEELSKFKTSTGSN